MTMDLESYRTSIRLILICKGLYGGKREKSAYVRWKPARQSSRLSDYIYIYIYICMYIYLYQMDCVCQRYHIECLTRTCADDCYNCWKNIVYMTWVWTFFNNFIYIYIYAYICIRSNNSLSLFGSEPLYEPRLLYFQLTSLEHTLVEFESKCSNIY